MKKTKEQLFDIIADGKNEEAVEFLLQEDQAKGGKHQLKLLSFKKGYKSLTKDNYPNYEDLIDRWIIITQELITWINENYSA